MQLQMQKIQTNNQTKNALLTNIEDFDFLTFLQEI